MTVPTRPVLRWHGGKWLLAPWIIGFFPEHRVYVEPFGGAASVLLRKERVTTEIYNDLDADLVNLFKVLRDRPEELRRAIALTPFARDEYRSLYEPAEEPIERARRFRRTVVHGSVVQGRHVAVRVRYPRKRRCLRVAVVVLSGYPSALYDAALVGWSRFEREALADGARPRTEVVWINRACAAALLAEGRRPEQLSFLEVAE